MASSTEVFKVVSIDDLAVQEIYKELMETSVAEGSIYIKAKETLQAIFEDNDIKSTERGVIIAQTVTQMSSSLEATCLSAAIQIAKENRDGPYELAKLKAATVLVQEQANEVATKIDQVDIDNKLKVMSGWKAQAELYRDYGVKAYDLLVTTDIIPLTSYADYGVKVETLKKAQVDTYATYANSYRTNGKVTYTTQVSTGQFDVVTADTNGLTDAQTKVAIRQEQGFDDNQRQHVVNSSASMIGLLLSTEASGIDYSSYLTSWNNAVTYLNTDH